MARLIAIPIESGVVFRFRLRRRPSEASSAARSCLQMSAGRMVGDSYVELEAALHRPAVAPLQRYQVELDRFQILQQQLDGGKALEAGERFEVSPTGGTGLHLEQLSTIIRLQ